MQEFNHYPVMKKEAVEVLNCESGKIYIDATLGGGGYSELILQKISPDGKLFSFDVDIDAINSSREKLKDYENLTIINDSYTNIKKYLDEYKIDKITGGIVFDLGASTPQLTSPERGFSFSKNSKLDMRFDQSANFSAYDLINDYKEEELVRIFSEYGEERFSKRIAKRIIEVRKIKNIETTQDLVNIVFEATPRIKSKIHPATRVFQAIRIEVNHELDNIKNTLNDVLTLLSDGAILSIVTFHSLEDRIVKQFFKHYSREWFGEPWKVSEQSHVFGIDYNAPLLELVNKKPYLPSEEEIKVNPASRSAKLRAARRIN
ncbi:16S rRNA (cytosine(1402)-N(4))-methyltransferase RsmH [bacterium]|nr:16S rRNA (cytosine(1402)-N(4))-methyltransferase RsmH [bacterium]